MTSLINDSGWVQVNTLVKEKYGKELLYRSIKLVTEQDRLITESYYSRGEDLIIPLKLKNCELGDIVVSHGSLLSPQQKSEITDLIRFLVEPKLYSLQLKKSEDNLLSLKTNRLSLVDTKKVVSLYKSENFKRNTLSQILLLKSHTEITRNKVALKVHEMTGRNLFVRLDDIIATLTTKEDLKSLSDITIYIEDVDRLNSETFSLLQDFLELNTADGPLFLVGSSLSLEQIEAKNWPLAFKNEAMGFFFDIDRVPISQQTSSDILELLFFQLDNILS